MSLIGKYVLPLAFMGSVIFTSCGGGSEAPTQSNENKVIMHMLSDAEELTPLNSNDNSSTIIQTFTHQHLLNVDHQTDEITPVLLAKRPDFVNNEDGTLLVNMELRPEAKWDDGSAITANDVDFTLRVLKNPETDNKALKPYFDKVMDIQIDKENPLKFTLVYAEPYHALESAFSDLPIIQAKIYDPEGLMKNFTVKQLFADTKGDNALVKDPTIKKFAEQFNGSKFQREVVSGSGPYQFKKWETGQRIILEKKKDWWGTSLAKTSHWFEAGPEEMVFQIVNDLATATVALKGAKLDAMHSIQPKDFVTDLRKDEDFTKRYATFTPPLFSYDYMCFNTRLDMFNTPKVRIALSHVMNVQQLIDSYCYGLGEPVASFTHPTIKARLNPNVKPYKFDLDLAKKMLAEEGWADTDGNGILDKEFDGEKKEFKFTLNYNNGNERRGRACLIFQEAARKVGISVDVVPLEWAVLLENNKTHKFDMFVLGWVSSPLESDPKQIWHSDSSNDGGSNYATFGTPESDALIEKLRSTMDAKERAELYKKLHQIIHDEAPYIFLLAQKERIAVNNRFGNITVSGNRPNYWAQGFTVSTPTPN